MAAREDRVTGLAGLLRSRIEASGPISLAEFMDAAANHAEFGAYRRADPLGKAGHFITAPEISQMFGELIGAWCVQMWLTMGAPGHLILAELGPGRGTLMADLLRVADADPRFKSARSVHLVETSPVLRKAQARLLAMANPVWHESPDDLPAGPLLLVANEFFDALPIRQFVYSARQWRERLIGLKGDRFDFTDGPVADLEAPVATDGDVFETCQPARDIVAALGARLVSQGGAALIIDYGHRASAIGETVQAVREHAFAQLLSDPGSADLSAHVDFCALARAAYPARSWGPIDQGAFLRSLGIELRAASLMRAHPGKAEDIERACRRLIAREEMGTLFKAMALTDISFPAPPGFASGTHD